MGKEKGEKEQQVVIVNNIELPSTEEVRTISLYGHIVEGRCAETVNALLYLRDTAHGVGFEDPEDPDSAIVTYAKPITMVISTEGGSASDMFSVYDTMRMTKKACEIRTFGVGKVMSAGVLLLAAGTKGERKIGANCRVMIHGVMGGFGGSLTNMENEIAEVRWIQDRFIKCLAAETSLTESKIRKMLNKQIDIYLSAEEAVKFGIADEIV